MTLAANRKISILIIGTFLIGIIAGLFFSRVREESKKSDILTFTTQSINGNEVTIPTEQIPCPREEEIRSGQQVIMDNPLVERAHELFSFKQGIVSENYTLRGPAGPKDDWKGQLIEYPLDQVTAGVDGSSGMCVYSSLGKDMALLRYDGIDKNCEALSTASFVGFSCPQ